MIFFIVAFFYGAMLVASEQDWDVKRLIRINTAVSRIINAQYEPTGHMHMKSCTEIKEKTRHLNGGNLPIPPQAKQPIIDLLIQEFGRNHNESVTYLKKYGRAFKIYDLSIEKTLELLAEQYEFQSDSDDEYEPAQFFASLLSDNIASKNNKK